MLFMEKLFFLFCYFSMLMFRCICMSSPQISLFLYFITFLLYKIARPTTKIQPKFSIISWLLYLALTLYFSHSRCLNHLPVELQYSLAVCGFLFNIHSFVGFFFGQPKYHFFCLIYVTFSLVLFVLCYFNCGRKSLKLPPEICASVIF